MLLIGTNAFADSRLKEEMYESSFLGSGNIIVSKVSKIASESSDFTSYYNSLYDAPFDGVKVFAMKFTSKDSVIPKTGGYYKPWQIFREYCKAKNAKVSVWNNGYDYIITASVKGKIQSALFYEVKYEPRKGSNVFDPYKVKAYYLNPDGFSEYIANLGETGKLYDEQKILIDVNNK